MAVKSLQFFIREAAIQKEVNSWTFDDCKDYLKKHSRDSSQNKLLQKKISIVKNRQGNIINKAGLSEIASYIKKGNLDPNLSKVLKGRLSQLAKFSSTPERKKLFSDWNINDITVYLMNSAPKQCSDNSHPNWKSICTFQNTGIYLWALGYNVVRPLGAGGFGCVWECDGKAVKVMPNDYSAKTEILSAQKMAELINKDTTGKSKKYFNYLVSTGKNSAVLKGVLAQSDLYDAAVKRVTDGKAESKKNTKKIDTLLRQIIQVDKALIQLHSLGYSHNDVKPQNFLKVDKSILDAKKAIKMSKDGKLHQRRTQLADFGGISKIPQNSQEEEYEKTHSSDLVYTPYFSPKNIRREFTKEAIEKRDVFALGASALEMLLEKIPTGNGRPEPRITIAKPNDSICGTYKLDEYYGGTSRQNMFSLLDVIRKMMDETYSSRTTLEESLALLRAVKSGK